MYDALIHDFIPVRYIIMLIAHQRPVNEDSRFPLARVQKALLLNNCSSSSRALKCTRDRTPIICKVYINI